MKIWPFICKTCGAPVQQVTYCRYGPRPLTIWKHFGNQWRSGTCKRPPHVIPNTPLMIGAREVLTLEEFERHKAAELAKPLP